MVFRGCTCIYCNLFEHYWQAVSSCRGRFIVPAYTKTPTKWGDGNACAVKWKRIFNNVKTHICWNGYTFLEMQGYGHDESAPTPNGVFATNFVGVRGYIAECFAIHFGVYATHLRNVRNVFVFCMLHIRITKVCFLTCKSMVFDVQKGGFWVTTNPWKWRKIEVGANWLTMSTKRNDLHKIALFAKGSNMQIQAKVQLLNRYPILP